MNWTRKIPQPPAVTVEEMATRVLQSRQKSAMVGAWLATGMRWYTEGNVAVKLDEVRAEQLLDAYRKAYVSLNLHFPDIVATVESCRPAVANRATVTAYRKTSEGELIVVADDCGWRRFDFNLHGFVVDIWPSAQIALNHQKNGVLVYLVEGQAVGVLMPVLGVDCQPPQWARRLPK